jgi:hypothetical protein
MRAAGQHKNVALEHQVTPGSDSFFSCDPFKMLYFLALLVAAVCTASTFDSPFEAFNLRARSKNGIPSSFQWNSTGPLIFPKNDTRGIAGIKDPSIIEINGTYHVFASTAQAAGYSLVYLNFTDFNKANSAPFYYLDQSGIGTGYRAAPEVFFFKPQGLWYLIFQNGNSAYSTNKDISDPAGWSTPTNFFADEPSIVAQNIGNGYWVDMWTICDATDCYLFFSDDNGHLYRASTPLSSFPSGMSEPVIAKSADLDHRNSLFEASCVYYVGNGTYMLIVEAIGTDGNRYFRSWTSSSLNSTWTDLAATEANSFARANNVVFTGPAWTKSISHGEMVRSQTDQTLTITPCNLRFLYQGVDPSANTTYNALPWRLGLLTQTNSAC